MSSYGTYLKQTMERKCMLFVTLISNLRGVGTMSHLLTWEESNLFGKGNFLNINHGATNSQEKSD